MSCIQGMSSLLETGRGTEPFRPLRRLEERTDLTVKAMPPPETWGSHPRLDDVAASRLEPRR
jgi:hypothetical protein